MTPENTVCLQNPKFRLRPSSAVLTCICSAISAEHTCVMLVVWAQTLMESHQDADVANKLYQRMSVHGSSCWSTGHCNHCCEQSNLRTGVVCPHVPTARGRLKNHPLLYNNELQVKYIYTYKYIYIDIYIYTYIHTHMYTYYEYI
jgi:hypothetical protein